MVFSIPSVPVSGWWSQVYTTGPAIETGHSGFAWEESQVDTPVEPHGRTEAAELQT